MARYSVSLSSKRGDERVCITVLCSARKSLEAYAILAIGGHNLRLNSSKRFRDYADVASKR